MSDFVCDICDTTFTTKRGLSSHNKNPPMKCKKIKSRSVRRSETEILSRLKKARSLYEKIICEQEVIKQKLKEINKRKKDAEKDIESCLLDLDCGDTQEELQYEKHKNYFVHPTLLENGEKILLNKSKNVVAILRKNDEDEWELDDEITDEEKTYIEETIGLTIDQ